MLVFLLYKILHSDVCKLDRNKLAGVQEAGYVELGQSPFMEEDSMDESDSVDFIQPETTASDRDSDELVLKKPKYVKSKSLSDLLSDKPRQAPAQRKLTQWERPSIEAVKAISHLNVLSAYGDTAGAQRARRKPPSRESRGEINCVAKLQVSVGFSQTAQRLQVTIIRAQDFPEAISDSAMSIHLTLMPSKRYRFKTKTKATSDVIINETFVMRGISANELMESSFRFRIYAQGSMKAGKLLGETQTHVTDFDLDDDVSTMWIMVPPAAEEQKKLSKKRKQ